MDTLAERTAHKTKVMTVVKETLDQVITLNASVDVYITASKTYHTAMEELRALQAKERNNIAMAKVW